MISSEQIETIIQVMMQKPNASSLGALSLKFGVSYGHLQKSFKHWVGITPQQFQQFLTPEYAKQNLIVGNAILQTAFEIGPSSTSRPHNAVVVATGLSPGEFASPAELKIRYARFDSPFGPCLVAETHRGICALLFETSQMDVVTDLNRRFKGATIEPGIISQQDEIVRHLNQLNQTSGLRLHLMGSNFQMQVWKALLEIPLGHFCSYQTIAQVIGSHPRAVGQAVGSNPISVLIPCHRVLRQTGDWGGYYWGLGKKGLLIGAEGHIANSGHR